MVANLKTCSADELDKQIRYLERTPVRGIAELLRDRRGTLQKGNVRTLTQLGVLKTEFGQLGALVATSPEGEGKFRVSEVVPILRNNPGADDLLLQQIEAFIEKDKRGQVEYNVTIFSYGYDLILKDGNKRTIAFYERRKGTSNDNIEFPVFVVQLAG